MARKGEQVPPAHDLTARVGLVAGLNGQPVVEIQRATLDAGASLVQTWRDLEPIIKQLIGKVRRHVDADSIEDADAAKLLSTCATVVNKVGAAAQGVLRASEGMAKLALLLDGGVQRPQPKAMTEKQMSLVVLETVKRIAQERHQCVCGYTPPPIEVQPDGG